AMSADALTAAKALWRAEQPKVGTNVDQSNGRDNRGNLPMTDAAATIELLITTNGDPVYRSRLQQLVPEMVQNFELIGGAAVRAIPYMGADYRAQLIPAVKALKARADTLLSKNPFGVPIAEGGWAGSGLVANFGTNMYLLHHAFPEIVGPEYTLNALDYMLGRHPANNLSLVSTVGTNSKLIAYRHNRADYISV